MQMYVTVGSNKLDESVPFYDALLGVLGWGILYDDPEGGRFYGNPDSGAFAVVRPFNKDMATIGNGTMIGFAMKSRAEVDIFYDKAMALGGTDEGAPGLRGPEEMGAYFAYFRDLDGNKLCAFNWTTTQA
jgi:catechol 2,3-dioxygenase-like lactoylglutathione lyase family enzyme